MKLAILKNYSNVGKLHGDGGAFEKGHVKHFDFSTLSDLKQLLINTANQPKMCVSIGNFPKNGKVVPQKNAQIGEMTRTKAVVNTGHILVIDNDFGSDYDRDMFSTYWDAFDGVGYVVTKSGSTLAGKKEHGSHTYYIVNDGVRNLKLAMGYLEAICIVEGQCKVEFYKTGKAVVKTPIDLALSQSSRVVYEDDTKPHLVKGEDSLDLSEFPARYEKVLVKAQKIVKGMLKKVEKKSLKLHAKYVKATTGKKIKGGTKQVKLSLKNYGKYEINEKFKLHVDGEFVGTVGDLIMGKLEDVIEFSDLYEPDYAGGSQKAIYYAETKTFFSQAHGGVKYTVVLSDKFNDKLVAEFLKEVPYLQDAYDIDKELVDIIKTRNVVDKKRMVRDYARSNGVAPTDVEKEIDRLSVLRETFEKFFNLWLIGEYHKTVNPENRLKNLIDYRDTSHMVNTGGKVVIVSTYKDDEGNRITNMNSLDTENKMWSDRKTTLLTVNKQNGETSFKKVNTPDLFISGTVDDSEDDAGAIEPCRRHIGIDFAPNKDLEVSYNLFNEFPVTSKKGDISFWRKHMRKVYGKSHYEFMMDFFADMYQNPDRKVGFAVVVRGTKGTGKNTFEEVLGRKLLNSENYFRTASTQQLFGRFNKALASNLLTVGQEIVWGGDHSHDSVLKDMITEKTRVLEVKGLDAFTINNFSRLYMTSNADWVVPASIDERRFYVASTKENVWSKREWGCFYKKLNEDGVVEALMYEMMNRDLSDFNHIFCPVTTELGQQKKETLYGVSRFVADAISNGYFGKLDVNGINSQTRYTENKFISTDILFAKYDENNDTRKMNKIQFGMQLHEFGFDKKSRVNSNRGYILPPVKKIVSLFKEKFGIEIDIEV